MILVVLSHWAIINSKTTKQIGILKINTIANLISERDDILMLSMLGKIFSGQHFKIFFFVSQKIGFDIPCKMSQMETK